MKKIIVSWVLGQLLMLSGLCFAQQAPHRLGGFVLGDDIAKYSEKLKTDTCIPIRHMECISEVETQPVEGFKSGLIYYGSCTGQKQIIRIKLKYENPSEKFYNELLGRFKKRFGEPDEWKGDPFHIVVAWKWYFTDKDKNKISLILQHNTKDEEEKKGNSVKLTLTSLMEAERRCFRQKKAASDKGKQQRRNRSEAVSWEKLIPR
ncbi:hypothetical protein DENIS_3415 [Desulfonema ishimotonii]|uniref:Secreted protein n=1 Tax=Desulfonema ishimotonii TaxID=45657 RepID=A0A401FZS6_9BACT|nr:hypothetical protein [Desulfonema ishimotonii]GBC62443.1 hypothetical protein DENIS_3415 [Desulfonema ishimotonii]